MTRVVLLTARTNAFSLLMQVITLVRSSLPFASSSSARLTLSRPLPPLARLSPTARRSTVAHDLAYYNFPLLDHGCVVAVVAVAARRSSLAHADLALLSIRSLAGFLEVKIYISSVLVTRACILLALLAVLPALTRPSPARSQSTFAARRATRRPSSPTRPAHRASRARPRRLAVARRRRARSTSRYRSTSRRRRTSTTRASAGSLRARRSPARGRTPSSSSRRGPTRRRGRAARKATSS